MDLEPCDAEGHHDIGHGVGLGEQIADLGQRVDIPLGDVMLLHGLHPALLKAALFHLALTDGLHDLEAHFGVQPHGDQIQHDIVTAAHRLQNGGGTADDQFPCVAQPHIRAVGKAGQAHQRIEILGQGVHQHPTGEAGVELRDGHGAGGAQQLVVFKAQHLGGNKNAHGVRIVQRDLAGVDAGKILQHPDHGGVIVTQHIQLQEVILHAVVFKMGGDGIGVLGIRRVLHGGEILHIHVIRHHHQTAGVLARGAPHSHAALNEAVLLGTGHLPAVLLQIVLDKGVHRLVLQGADGTGPEHLRLTEHLHGVAVGSGLIFPGKVQVDIRHLAAAVAKERLKGDVEAVLDVLLPADGADLIRHIGAAAEAAVGDKLRMAALGAAVVGRQGVDLGDARHIGHQRRAHRAS